MRSKTLGAMLIALSALAVGAAPAGAIVANTANGRVGYLPLNGVEPAQASMPKGFTVPNGEPPLLYHGGPVMHSQEAYAIFWAPSGFSFPSGYTAAIEGFLKNVVADSGKSTNVYSVSAQYDEGGAGNAAYSDTFGGSVTDTNAYPTSDTCPTYKGVETFTACITDAKLEDEVEAVVNAQGWPDGLEAEYYVVLPPQVGSCFETAGNVCFDKQFCAYHSFSEPAEDIYSNISYSPGDVIGCGVGEYPNGHANGNVDDTFSGLSHEANESITDPLLNAWFDKKGNENGDECRNTKFHEDFGPPLGGGSGTLFNQAIGSAHYYLQQEWSNDVGDCAQRVEPAAVPTIAGPGEATPGQTVFFDGSGSLPGATEIVSFSWDFGDGGTASGETAFHAFTNPGVFTVSLTVEDEWGLIYSATHKVTVSDGEVVVEELPPGTVEEARRKIEEANPPASLQSPSVALCIVPKLFGKTLGQAEAALKGAHCKLGRVAQPKAKKGGKAPVLVVKSSSPAVGAKPAGGTVNLTLGPKPKPKKHHHAH